MDLNNKMKVLTPFEICIQATELLNEIVRLKEHVSWLEAVICDLENQIVELKQELYFIF